MKKSFIALFAVAIILCVITLAYAIPDLLSSTEYNANGIVSSAQAYVCQVNFTDINWTSQDRIQLLTGTSSGVNWTQVGTNGYSNGNGTNWITLATIAGANQGTVAVKYSPTCLYFPYGVYLNSNTANVNWTTDIQYQQM